MKRSILGFLAVAVLWTQPLLATSSREGGEKQKQKEVANPTGHAATTGLQANVQDAMSNEQLSTVENDLQAPVATIGGNVHSAVVGTHDTEENVVTSVNKKEHRHNLLSKLLKPNRVHKAHSDGYTFGILAFICGLTGFVLGWFAWPVGLLFAVLAIVFGAVGLSGGRSGNLFALAGLILGILTIVLPLFFFWWIAVF